MFTAGKHVVAVCAALTFAVALAPILTKGYAADSANSDESVMGRWTGEITIPTGRKIIAIDISAVGDRALTVKYAPPRECTIKAEYVDTDGEMVQKYTVKDSNGGFCNKLLLGSLSLKEQPNAMLMYEVTYADKKATAREYGVLKHPK